MDGGVEKRYGGWAGDRLDKSSYAVDRLGRDNGA